MELTWTAATKTLPLPGDISITTLNHQGTASSWWNNLAPVSKTVQPTVSADGKTYVCEMQTESCGLAISVEGARPAAEYAVPSVRVLVAETWKQMDFEIEWGYKPGAPEKDYSGRIEVYDGRLAGLSPLDGDTATRISAASWQRHPGLPPFVLERLCHRSPPRQRIHLQRARGVWAAGQDLRGGCFSGAFPQPCW